MLSYGELDRGRMAQDMMLQQNGNALFVFLFWGVKKFRVEF